MDTQQQYERARKRVQQIKGFYTHLPPTCWSTHCWSCSASRRASRGPSGRCSVGGLAWSHTHSPSLVLAECSVPTGSSARSAS